MQRYKVFIYDSPIYLRKQGDISDITCKVLDYKDLDLYDIFQQLTNTSTVEEVAIVADDLEMLWDSFRSMFKFIIASGGAVFKDDSMLIIKRLGRTDIPKGKLEKGEWIDQCAIREVEEECGISGLQIVNKLEPTYHCYEMKGKWCLKKTYWYQMETSDTSDLVPQIEEDIEWVKWINKKEVSELTSDTYNSIKEVLNQVI